MKANNGFDIIIVGAGPAGGMLGYYLALEGLTVLIVEKKALPRYKACGGGVTKRALDILPFSIESILEDITYKPAVTIRNKEFSLKPFDAPIIGMVMRDRFDLFITHQAMMAGATVLENTEFISLSESAGILDIETSQGIFRSRFIVGADGIHGKVHKALNLKIIKKYMTALEAEAYTEDSEIMNGLRHSAHFDFGAIEYGYGWLFPKLNHLSLGLVTLASHAHSMKNQLRFYLQKKNLAYCTTIKTLKGHLIAHGHNKANRYANNYGLVVGDAAGFADPITGEGIYFAIRGAQIAADIIIRTAKSFLGSCSLTLYNTAIKNEFVEELDYAEKISALFYGYPLISSLISQKYGSKIIEQYLQVISRKKTYQAFYNTEFNIPGITKMFLALSGKR